MVSVAVSRLAASFRASGAPSHPRGPALPIGTRACLALALAILCSWNAGASETAAAPAGRTKGEHAYRLFPALLARSGRPLLPVSVWERGDPGPVRRDIADRVPILANNMVVAFYGSPASRRMGILGEYPKEELASMLQGYASLYDRANGPAGVIPAFYIVYGTCWPRGEIGYLSGATLLEYIRYAASLGFLVFVDHQIGKFTVEEAMDRILPYLVYPNVHLAIDPEWRTVNPMKEIGSITAQELNDAQRRMQEYMIEHGIPGVRMLVVHQFQNRMITSRETVRADFDRVLLVHTADGFGSPALKRHSYGVNAKAANMPLKGFKLFFKSVYPGAGYDDPLLTPPEVLALDPAPVLVMYQ